MDNQSYWVYILHCENDSYYTGYTNDLAKRYQSHIDGTGKCKYTRSFKPLSIAQCWKIMGDKSLAMQIERQIKKMSRIEKEKIISHPSALSTDARIITVHKQDHYLVRSSAVRIKQPHPAIKTIPPIGVNKRKPATPVKEEM